MQTPILNYINVVTTLQLNRYIILSCFVCREIFNFVLLGLSMANTVFNIKDKVMISYHKQASYDTDGLILHNRRPTTVSYLKPL